MRKIILPILLFYSCSAAFCQNISGVINDYATITAFDPCNNKLTVSDATAFNSADYVLMIQMKGAQINSTNTASFGSITNYNNAGNYEFNFISAKSGNVLTLQNTPMNGYDIPGGVVQLVRVPIFINATVVASLSCLPWDGTKGGVLVFKVNNDLTLNANIDVSAKGFRGGTLCSNPDGGCTTGNMNYSYTVSSGLGAEKGEGIVVTTPSMNGGMGAQANGGGGGNKHNSGGGGGGNFSQGGKGGNQADFCPVVAIGGEGGRSLDYSGNRVFAGGGGGCSDNNNGVGTPGSTGGGIIIIDAAHINGNNFSISSNSPDVPVVVNNIGDGSGGGGAGGSIFISCNNFTGNLSLKANGGKGGDQNTVYPSCFGPGAGGGAGVVLFSAPGLPAGLTVTTNPGVAGIVLNGPATCNLQTYGAAPGSTGNGQLFNKSLVKSSTAFVPGLNNSTTFQKCSADDINLNVRTGTSYSWSPATALSATNVQQPVCSATTAISYTVTITTAGGCGYVDTVHVNISQSLQPSFAPIDDLCVGATPPLLSGSSLNSPPITGTWSPAVVTTADTGTTAYTFTPNSGQCADPLTINISVIKKAIDLLGSKDTSICPNTTLILNPGNFLSYSWNDHSIAPSFSVNNSGSYWVVVTAADGCTYSDTIKVKVLNCDDIFFPDSFTPDGNTLNDYFGPLGVLKNVSNYKMQIFNRYGVAVFTSLNPIEKWDGKYLGKIQGMGNFICVATYLYGQNKREVKKNLLLIR